jgi:hypothetical protein
METCLICLEATATQINPLLDIDFSKYPDICSCRIHSHFDCWMTYYLKKGFFECPICHTKIDQGTTVHTQNVLVQIRVPTSQIQVRERSFEDGLRQNKYCIVCGCFCCLGVFFVSLFVPVFMLAKK